MREPPKSWSECYERFEQLRIEHPEIWWNKTRDQISDLCFYAAADGFTFVPLTLVAMQDICPELNDPRSCRSGAKERYHPILQKEGFERISSGECHEHLFNLFKAHLSHAPVHLKSPPENRDSTKSKANFWVRPENLPFFAPPGQADKDYPFDADPDRIRIVPTAVYRRCRSVIDERLSIANGICEGCNKPAPFQKKTDGTPFLEVHHVKPLSEGGEDTVENTRALCPNCHRREHFGTPRFS